MSSCFCLFLCFTKKITKRSPNTMKLYSDFFGPEETLEAPREGQKIYERATSSHGGLFEDLFDVILAVCVCWDPINYGFIIRLFIESNWIFSELYYVWLFYSLVFLSSPSIYLFWPIRLIYLQWEMCLVVGSILRCPYSVTGGVARYVSILLLLGVKWWGSIILIALALSTLCHHASSITLFVMNLIP